MRAQIVAILFAMLLTGCQESRVGCPPDFLNCSGACVAFLEDVNHCGECGTQCDGGTCELGTCQ
jgi:hypothetical protein